MTIDKLIETTEAHAPEALEQLIAEVRRLKTACESAMHDLRSHDGDDEGGYIDDTEQDLRKAEYLRGIIRPVMAKDEIAIRAAAVVKMISGTLSEVYGGWTGPEKDELASRASIFASYVVRVETQKKAMRRCLEEGA